MYGQSVPQSLIEEVEIVDHLMTCYRNGIEPTSDKKAQAYEKGINVMQLKECMKEVYAETDRDEDEGFKWEEGND